MINLTICKTITKQSFVRLGHWSWRDWAATWATAQLIRFGEHLDAVVTMVAVANSFALRIAKDLRRIS
jgi:hypothetical protein